MHRNTHLSTVIVLWANRSVWIKFTENCQMTRTSYTEKCPKFVMIVDNRLRLDEITTDRRRNNFRCFVAEYKWDPGKTTPFRAMRPRRVSLQNVFN